MEDPLRPWRRRFRVWQNDRRLARENDVYTRLFQQQGLAVPDDDTIRETVSGRFPHLIPKPKGSLRTLAIYHSYNWEDTALKPALERFGPVVRYDWMNDFRPGSTSWHRSLRQDMNRHLLRFVDTLARGQGFHWIFTYLSGEQTTPETMAALCRFSVPVINLSLNDKENFVGKIRGGQALGVRDICRPVTLNWTSTGDALKKYCVEGALPLYLPEGANPDIHRPLDLEKTLDVSFVGQRYGNREETIDFLRQSGIRAEAYGAGWPNGPLTTEEMVRLYAKSRINLGFGGVSGHRDTYCLKGRDFEVPMSGGLYVTEYHPELAGCYELGKEIVVYEGLEDLREKIRDLLAHPEKAEAIRRRGLERARREHTWEMRFEKVLGLVGLLA